MNGLSCHKFELVDMPFTPLLHMHQERAPIAIYMQFNIGLTMKSQKFMQNLKRREKIIKEKFLELPLKFHWAVNSFRKLIKKKKKKKKRQERSLGFRKDNLGKKKITKEWQAFVFLSFLNLTDMAFTQLFHVYQERAPIAI